VYPLVILILLPEIVLDNDALVTPFFPVTVIVESNEMSEGTVMSIKNPEVIGFLIVKEISKVVTVDTVDVPKAIFEVENVIAFAPTTFSANVLEIS